MALLSMVFELGLYFSWLMRAVASSLELGGNDNFLAAIRSKPRDTRPAQRKRDARRLHLGALTSSLALAYKIR